MSNIYYKKIENKSMKSIYQIYTNTIFITVWLITDNILVLKTNGWQTNSETNFVSLDSNVLISLPRCNSIQLDFLVPKLAYFYIFWRYLF